MAYISKNRVLLDRQNFIWKKNIKRSWTKDYCANLKPKLGLKLFKHSTSHVIYFTFPFEANSSEGVEGRNWHFCVTTTSGLFYFGIEFFYLFIFWGFDIPRVTDLSLNCSEVFKGLVKRLTF